MSPGILATLLIVAGLVLVIAEVILPAHGFVGLLGGLALLAAVIVCFTIHPWLGIGLLVAAGIAAPFGGALLVKIWPRTPVGRSILLPPIPPNEAAAPVAVGQTGVTVSELRPMGMVEFDGQRVEALSEYGIVPPGTSVKVVALSNNRPTVRVA